MTSKRSQILIVGAGPTGLTAAAALTQLGIHVRVIDKGAARSDKSKALGVQAGTLECLEAALNKSLVDQMLAAGRPTYEAWIHLDERSPVWLNLRTIPSRYNFILILAQSETERLLEEYLSRFSITVERNTELLGLEERGNEVVSRLRLPSGELVEHTADFAIGCDGAHSVVRNQLGIPFDGNAYTGNFVLGDVKLQWSWPYDSIQTFASSRGLMAGFPMRGGEQRYRLILIPNSKAPEFETSTISLEEFSNIASALSQGRIEIESTNWMTRFRVHHRIVRQFRQGRVFLAGDAAHIHSPFGGQGMNTGIQDALNLSFKLKRVLSGSRDLVYLDRYEAERLPVAKNVVRGTDLASKAALLPETRLKSFARHNILPKVIGSSWIQKRVADAISEVAIAQKEIASYRS